MCFLSDATNDELYETTQQRAQWETSVDLGWTKTRALKKWDKIQYSAILCTQKIDFFQTRTKNKKQWSVQIKLKKKNKVNKKHITSNNAVQLDNRSKPNLENELIYTNIRRFEPNKFNWIIDFSWISASKQDQFKETQQISRGKHFHCVIEFEPNAFHDSTNCDAVVLV